MEHQIEQAMENITITDQEQIQPTSPSTAQSYPSSLSPLDVAGPSGQPSTSTSLSAGQLLPRFSNLYVTLHHPTVAEEAAYASQTRSRKRKAKANEGMGETGEGGGSKPKKAKTNAPVDNTEHNNEMLAEDEETSDRVLNEQASRLVKRAFIGLAMVNISDQPKGLTPLNTLRTVDMDQVQQLIGNIESLGDMRDEYPLAFLLKRNDVDLGSSEWQDGRPIFQPLNINTTIVCVAGNHRLRAAETLYNKGKNKLESAKKKAGKAVAGSKQQLELQSEVKELGEMVERLCWWPVKLYDSGMLILLRI